MDLKSKFRHIADFPKEGIDFIDITTVLNDKDAFKEAIDSMASLIDLSRCDVVVASEARGFILGAALAYKLGVRFVPVRKPGKLPYKTIKGSYELEYGTDSLEMHVDAINKGDKVVLVDDLIATGGTMGCVADMVKEMGGTVDKAVFLVELEELPGRKIIEDKGIEVISVVKI
ncbi:MAG: adenine phosphoribosyltransferase [Clostridia bacterium]|nr:adenine phosphoribosyltransferase [Clostridia bacterium]